ncbi:MAG: tetratricopeptide repeat protein, partial [Bryobacteraceae bacterium]
MARASIHCGLCAPADPFVAQHSADKDVFAIQLDVFVFSYVPNEELLAIFGFWQNLRVGPVRPCGVPPRPMLTSYGALTARLLLPTYSGILFRNRLLTGDEQTVRITPMKSSNATCCFSRRLLLLTALAWRPAFPALPQSHPGWEQLRQAAIAAYQRGDYKGSDENLAAALEMAQSSSKREPDLASAWSDLAATYQDMGEYGEAETLDRQALQARQKVFGATSQITAVSLNNLGSVLWIEGRPQEAEPLVRQAVAIWRRGPSKSVELINALSNLAGIYRAEARRPEAKRLCEEALELSRTAHISADLQVSAILNNLALVYLDEASYEKAGQLAGQALAIREKTSGADSSEAGMIVVTLGNIRREEGRYSEAELLYKRALTIHERVLGPSHLQVAIDLNNLSLVTR